MPDPHLERDRLRIVLATVAVSVVGMIISSFIPGSDWRTAVAINLIDNMLLVAHIVRRRDTFMLHLIAFGVVLGFVELFADAWLVDVTRSLDYSPGGGAFIWRSPFWMPFAWEVVAVQFAYIGVRLVERFGAVGVVLSGLIGAVNIPFYEEMALHTNWWVYRGAHMLSHTPYYIIVGEFVIAIAIALTARQVRREILSRTLLSGAVAGASIFAAYGAAWWLIDG